MPAPSSRAWTRLALQQLEERLALSWTSIPPSFVTPYQVTSVTLDTNASASGSAAITANEEDYYAFTAPRSGLYTFSALTPSSNLDTVLGIFTSSGQRIAYNDDISSTNRDSQVSVNLTAGQRYVFGITNYLGTPGGSYTWQVRGPVPTLADDRYEDNDTRATATNLGSLTSSSTLTGLVMADAADWFRFTTVATGTTSNFVSIAFTHSRGDLDLRLYDSAGNLLRYSDGVTDSEQISLQGLAGGTYFVQVYGYRGAFNPSYSLSINPPSSGGGGGGGTSGRTLYLNFDGYNISRSELVRWAGTDWASTVNEFDSDGNGISVQPLLRTRTDREQIISRILQLVQEDLRPFGITVQRHRAGAVEGVGATTIFLGRSTLTNNFYHVAVEVDIGNNNRTDIAFVGDEDWGSVERTALALADVTLHEAGHTYGLWHVNSGNDNESMGLRYSISDQNQWVRNTAFLDRTYVAYVDRNGFQHGPGPQNSYRRMLQTFGSTTGNLSGGSLMTGNVTTDNSRPGVFAITTHNPGVDVVTLRRLPSGAIEVNINGELYQLDRRFQRVEVYTSGDRNDRVRLLTRLPGVQVSVNRTLGADLQAIVKGNEAQADVWSGLLAGTGCRCSLCVGGFLSVHQSSETTAPSTGAPVETISMLDNQPQQPKSLQASQTSATPPIASTGWNLLNRLFQLTARRRGLLSDTSSSAVG